MPREVFGSDFAFLPRHQILTYEEIERLARIFRSLGVRKFRLTGGEPLLRHDLPELVSMLAAIPDADLALTTNGALLERRAPALAAAGLKRVTVSLDSLDDAVFQRMNDADFPVSQVLAGIEAAARVGLAPVKINAVVQRGVNDDGIVDLARCFRARGHILRFVEYMDVGASNGWRLDQVMSGREILDRLRAELPLEPLEPAYRGEVARRWRYSDGAGEIGLITSVSRPFCGDCTRARLSAEGRLFTCLFAAGGTDLKAPLRSGWSDEALAESIAGIWAEREDRYSEQRSAATPDRDRIEMSYIGG